MLIWYFVISGRGKWTRVNVNLAHLWVIWVEWTYVTELWCFHRVPTGLFSVFQIINDVLIRDTNRSHGDRWFCLLLLEELFDCHWLSDVIVLQILWILLPNGASFKFGLVARLWFSIIIAKAITYMQWLHRASAPSAVRKQGMRLRRRIRHGRRVTIARIEFTETLVANLAFSFLVRKEMIIIGLCTAIRGELWTVDVVGIRLEWNVSDDSLGPAHSPIITSDLA